MIMRLLGIFLIGVGLIWAVIAFDMRTSVTAGGQRIGSGEYAIDVPSVSVNNLGLMEQRRNHLLLAGLTAVAGVVLFGMGTLQQSNAPSLEARSRKCPHCAEFVKAEAKVCRFCQRDLPSLLTSAEESELIHQSTCPFCDANISVGAKKCPSCNIELPLGMLEPITEELAKFKTSKQFERDA